MNINLNSTIIEHFNKFGDYWIGKFYQYGIIIIAQGLNLKGSSGVSKILVFSTKKNKIVNFGYQSLQMVSKQVSNYEAERSIREYLEYKRERFSSNKNETKDLIFYKSKEIFLDPAIISHLDGHNFLMADRLARILNPDLINIYENVKAARLERYTLIKWGFPLNKEQCLALSRIDRYLLISARAGSGKTRVLSCKTGLLIDRYEVKPDQILVLAFNKKAASEIKERIKSNFNQPLFENARTFHSLAFQLVNPSEGILFDDNAEVSTQILSLFVQKIVKEKISNLEFLINIYGFFRKEYLEVEKSGFFLNDKEYYSFRKNLRWVTLYGERVKSTGEKMIADFLFEHDVSYRYEDASSWNEGVYRPDFKLIIDKKIIILEHWGIDPEDKKRGISKEWNISWDEYRKKIEQKREYWKEKQIPLIETSIKDMDEGRGKFETIIFEKLNSLGIFLQKLSEDKILSKLKEREYVISHLTNIFVRFIQLAKKRKWNSENISAKIIEYAAKNERESVFLKLAMEIFLIYEMKKSNSRPKLIDFDDLMIRAIDKIHTTKGSCEISVDYSKTRFVGLQEIRFILIDEYQDFSELFYELLEAIRQYNPFLQITCVGDDWQAINSFAGSDLKYFANFENYFNRAKLAYLLTNHRSRQRIVATGNALMVGRGNPGIPDKNKNGGVVKQYYIDDVWLEIREDEQFKESKLDDQRFIINDLVRDNIKKEPNVRLLASKYIKLCYSLLVNRENIGKKLAILSRTNRIEGVTLEKFRDQLIASLNYDEKKTIGNLDEKLKVITAHGYKGDEAEVVIIVNACNGSFPLLHPDNELFGIFGKNTYDAMCEERRLFYVALTRAEEHLYIISERDNYSVFLDELPILKPNPYDKPWDFGSEPR